MRLSLIAILFLAIVELAQSHKLVSVIQLIRHGVRYPKKSQSQVVGRIMDKLGVNQFEDLADVGRNMEYLLGRQTYHHYWKQLFGGTPDETKLNRNQIYVMSTFFSRTIESAQAYLCGLLEDLDVEEISSNQAVVAQPPWKNSAFVSSNSSLPVFGQKNKYFHSIPIVYSHVINHPLHSPFKFDVSEYDEADMFLKSFELGCPKIGELAAQSLKSQDYQDILHSKQVEQLLKAVKEETNEDQITIEQLKQIAGVHASQTYRNEPSLKLFEDHPQYAKTAEIVLGGYQYFFEAYNHQHKRMANTLMLRDIQKRMNKALSGKGARFVLYSAHESSLISILSALEVMNAKGFKDAIEGRTDSQESHFARTPPPGSSLGIELWSDEKGGHEVKLLFNGDYITIPICDNQLNCPLDKWKAWSDEFELEDLTEACGVHEVAEEYRKKAQLRKD